VTTEGFLCPAEPLAAAKAGSKRNVPGCDDASIVCAVIGMGKNLHMRVVAEGIETHEQLAYL